MTRDEFIDVCVKGGYCNSKVATMYSRKEPKEEYTDSDLINVYRMVEGALDIARDTGKYQQRLGYRTTKRYKQTDRMGSDKND